MDVDHVSQLTKEQESWLEKKLCVHCGKHPFVFKQKCPNPKYKGKLEMIRWGQATRVILAPPASSGSDNGKAREEAVHAFLTSYDVKEKDKEVEPEPAVEAARITEVESDEDFLWQFQIFYILHQLEVREVQTEALLDSGAYSCYINPQLVDRLNPATISLEKEIRVYNADTSHNKGEIIKKRVLLSITIGNHTSRQSLLVTDIGHKDVILGMSFLKKHNLEVAVQEEDLKNTNIPHIEDLMEFIGSQELDDNWNDMDSFIRWVSLSEDPDVQAVASLIMGLDTKRNQDRVPQNGEQDKDY
ncbi:uncharacterized protein LAESUDRAFT_761420 [Laetiporus sulphureus 93-53]|uniref:Aspartic peptidase DDI1-type domain-containing protein n=1 Tax=Laetiporus sulphureus 93-53 TaxID=1314785 RepID=A0A165D374_9APHY|nr:uncharacterized protein LAESUDRAFT_761420 [Laetiporus sulphureus 93-53]KZT04067.1 hypothetical protein LAESUDRAFT_761420 [Laetiporus sulphureus 93-53]